MIPRNVLYLSLSLVSGGLCTIAASSLAAEDVASQAPVSASAVTPAMPAAPSEFEDKAAFNSMGYMVAKQMRMNVGFNEQQIAWICEGFKAGATDASVPADYREELHRAEMIYRSHTMKMMEMKREEADANMKLGQAYVDALPDRDKLTKTESGLYYEILNPGNLEKKPARSDKVKISYVGSFIDGKVFDKSESPVELDVRGVVPGFSEGLQLIGEGGKIRLIIPGNLGYGMQPPPNSEIKPGAMLIFEAEIVEVIKGAEKPVMNQPQAMENGRPQIKRVHRDGSMTPPPPPPTTPPPPLPPEILAQLKNPPKNLPPPPPSAKAETNQATKESTAEESK